MAPSGSRMGMIEDPLIDDIADPPRKLETQISGQFNGDIRMATFAWQLLHSNIRLEDSVCQ